jgi:EAL domain-containing protein (putative c-di-GMP-specific phosphodiesterase class I)
MEIVGCELLTSNAIPNDVLFAHSNPIQDWYLFHKAIADYLKYIPAYLLTIPDFGWTVNMSPKCLVDNIEAYSIFYSTIREMYIELTEVEKITKAEIRVIKPFKDRIIIDDFGCETTNIGVIRDLKPAGVKIDRVFWECNKELGAEMVKELKKHCKFIIGEKIESQEEFELMRSIGIDIIQGYYMCPFEQEILEYHENAAEIII